MVNSDVASESLVKLYFEDLRTFILESESRLNQVIESRFSILEEVLRCKSAAEVTSQTSNGGVDQVEPPPIAPAEWQRRPRWKGERWQEPKPLSEKSSIATLGEHATSSRYRSRECWYEKSGTCRFGDDCNFKHTGFIEEPLDEQRHVGNGWSEYDKKPRKAMRSRRLCKLFQAGCCASGDDCFFEHSDFSAEGCWKTSRCSDYMKTGDCQKKNCYFAHGEHELRTPPEFKDVAGYKRALCTYFMWPELYCPNASAACFDAHGELDLRREPLTLPPEVGNQQVQCGSPFVVSENAELWSSISEWKQIDTILVGQKLLASGPSEISDGYNMLPIIPEGAVELRFVKQTFDIVAAAESVFEFADAHVHLDHVLLSRKHGSSWMYKTIPCRFSWSDCPYGQDCLHFHEGQGDLHSRPTYRFEDFDALFSEIAALPGATCAGCVQVCCGPDSIDATMQLVDWGRKHLDSRIYATFGIHPSTFEMYTEEMELHIESCLDRCGRQAVAVGECGLDYNKREQDLEKEPELYTRMKDVFAKQARLAVRRGLPLVIHARDAILDTFEVLRETVPATHAVYLHAFMGDIGQMSEFIESWPNGYIGLTGCVNWPAATLAWNGSLAEVARAVPLDRLLLETDGPFMAPLPHRGEESHPGHIPLIAAGIAQLRERSTALEILQVTTANFKRFFRLEQTANMEDATI